MVSGAPYRCGRSHDFRSNALFTYTSRGKLVDGGFIEARDCPQGAGDQVQFVLNDKVGRIERPAIVQRAAFTRLGGTIKADALRKAIDMSKESAGFAHPGQRGKFIDGGDQKSWQSPVDRFVHCEHRQRPVAAEIAAGVDAADLQIGGSKHIRCTRERCRLELRATPGTSLERRWSAFVAPARIAPNAADRSGLVRVSLAAELVR